MNLFEFISYRISLLERPTPNGGLAPVCPGPTCGQLAVTLQSNLIQPEFLLHYSVLFIQKDFT